MTTGLQAVAVPRDGGVCVVAQGELDLAGAPVLDAVLRAAEASAAPEIVVDIQAVSFIDSTGLRTLLQAQVRSLRDGRPLRLTRGSAQAQRLFALLAVEQHLAFIDDDCCP